VPNVGNVSDVEEELKDLLLKKQQRLAEMRKYDEAEESACNTGLLIAVVLGYFVGKALR